MTAGATWPDTPVLVLRGGTVVDGTGADPRLADVRLAGGLVTEVAAPGGVATEGADVVDATGTWVLPGFIDVHTHSDMSLVIDGRGESKIGQGVTTEVVGNCGFSAYPISADRRAEHLALLAGIGDPPTDVDWDDFAGYAAALERGGTAVNVAALVGHGQLRLAVLGADDVPAGPDALAAMGALLQDALDQGAYGMSTGLTYVPSRFADAAELTALCRVLADNDALYATHARGSGAASVEETVRLARDTGVRAQYSHLAINDPARWGSAAELLAIIDGARADGLDVAADVYPYAASASALTQYLPTWVQTGGVAALQERLGDPVVAARAEDELARGWGPGGRIPWFWDKVVVSRGDGLSGVVDGETIEAAAARIGVPPARLVLDLVREGGNRVQVILFYRTEQDMRTFLAHPHTLVGSDGYALPYEQPDRRPHPRAYGTHVRVLGRYVRDEPVVGLADVVHRMTGAVAERLGISDRGVLRPGAAADVVVVDPETVIDRATFTDPGQPPDGVRLVVCNGWPVVRDGVQSDRRPGMVLRRPRRAT